MSQDLINLIILNNAASYELKFAGIASHKGTKNRYWLIIYPDSDAVIQREYKSIKSAKVGFARSYRRSSGEKDIKPEWSRDLLSYSFQKKKKKEEAPKINGG